MGKGLQKRPNAEGTTFIQVNVAPGQQLHKLVEISSLEFTTLGLPCCRRGWCSWCRCRCRSRLVATSKVQSEDVCSVRGEFNLQDIENVRPDAKKAPTNLGQRRKLLQVTKAQRGTTLIVLFESTRYKVD